MSHDKKNALAEGTDDAGHDVPVKQADTLGIGELHALDQIIRPYFEGHWKNQLEKSKLEIDFELKVMKTESRHRGWLVVGTFAVIFSVILLAFYLFLTGRDEHAMQIIIGVVLVVTSSIAGYGWHAAKRSLSSDVE